MASPSHQGNVDMPIAIEDLEDDGHAEGTTAHVELRDDEVVDAQDQPPVQARPRPSITKSMQARLNAFHQRQATKNQVMPERAAEPVEESLFVDQDSREPSPDPAQAFAQLNRAYANRKRKGLVTTEEEIEYMRAEYAEQARLSMLAADNASPSPEPDDDAILAAALTEELQNSGQGQKRSGALLGEGGPPAKKQRKPRAKKAARGDQGDASAKQSKTTKARASKKQPLPPSMLNLQSVAGNDVFVDVAANTALDQQPTFDKTGRKDVALKQMIASFPIEAKKDVKIDFKYLKEQIATFTTPGRVHPDNGLWKVSGMKSSLKSYQILGVAFCRQRENAIQEPRGGILADQMGLGKTIMALTNIVDARPLHKHNCRTTLIVASPALIHQWRGEIYKHCHIVTRKDQAGVGEPMEYKANNLTSMDEQIKTILRHDIVFTTYAQVSKSYPKADCPAEYTTAAEKEAWWHQHYEENKGILHRVKFFRILLDEAQAIKNHMSKTSQACRAVVAQHHWAISGTPVQNSIEEFYPFFLFLKDPQAVTLRLWRQNFKKTPQDPDGTERLAVFLRKVMVRRTHADKLFGAKLLSLPTPTNNICWLDLNAIESKLYSIVKARMMQKINAFQKNGELERRYSTIWEMLLRLRQLTSHLALIQKPLMGLLEEEDVECLSKLATTIEEQLADDSITMMSELREQLQNSISTVGTVSAIKADGTVLRETEASSARAKEINEDLDLGGKHGQSYPFSRILDTVVNSEDYDKIRDKTLCKSCRQPPNDPGVTSCGCIICYVCLSDLAASAARRGRDTTLCICGEHYTSWERCGERLVAFKEHYANILGGPFDTGRRKRASEELDARWSTMSGDILPSQKTMAIKMLIHHWIVADNGVKIIVYTQFLEMIRILARVMSSEGWEFVSYHGKMSHDARANAIEEFQDPKKNKRVFLMSLKAGGLGLNLTGASKVINCEPWWNYAVEQQAFCRVFRIGQLKKTEMARLVVRGTIDEAMIHLQNNKIIEIDGLMDEAKLKKHLSIPQMIKLLNTSNPEEGVEPWVFADSTLDDVPPPPDADEEPPRGVYGRRA